MALKLGLQNIRENLQNRAAANGVTTFKTPANPATSTPLPTPTPSAPKIPASFGGAATFPSAATKVSTPTTNYGGNGNVYNELLYSKKQYDAGNKNWAANNAKQYYSQLSPEEAVKIQGMNTQQLTDYINGMNQGPTNAAVPKVAPISTNVTPSNQPSSQYGSYTPTYTGPDMTGMQNQLKDIFMNRQASELQKLREARDTVLQGYNSQETLAKQSAYDNRNQADTTNLQNAMAMREQMANSGLNADGQNLTVQAGLNAQRLAALGGINQQETNALQDIGQKRALLQNNAANNELALTQQINSDQAAAMFDLMKYGDTRAFDTEKYNYGRFRDDVSQQFAEDQFGWSKEMDVADRLGKLGTERTLAGQAQDLANKNSNWGAYMDMVNQTGNLGKGPAETWKNLVDNAYGGGQTLAGNQQKFNQDMSNKQYDRDVLESDRGYKYQTGRDAVSDRQWRDQFNRGNYEFEQNYGLSRDDNDRQWAQLEYEMENGSGRSNNAISSAAAGQMLDQSLSKIVGYDEDNKPVYGKITDPVSREKAFIDAWNTSGITPGPDTIEMLTKAGYTSQEVAFLKKKYPKAFNSGGGMSGSSSTSVNVPQQYQPLIDKYSSKWSLPADLFAKVISTESSYNPKAVSSAGAQGLGQLMPDTAKGLGVKDPFDPDQNLNGAAQYLKGLLDTYKGDYTKALAGYNAGGGRVKRAVEKYGNNWLAHMPEETRKYVKKILG